MADDEYRVFIIDDDSSVRTGLSRLLRSAGYSTEVFATAAEYLQREEYDGTACLILDVMMPGVTGPMLQKQLIERGDDFPIIFLTAHGSLASCVQVIKRGGANYFQKPVDDAVLVEAVDKALTRHRSTRNNRPSRVDGKQTVQILTSRELAILRLILDGSSNRQIADYFQLSNDSVMDCRQKIRQKTGNWPVADRNSV